MKIKKLSIESFGKFNNTVINLCEGVNVLYGYNESGKSTICAFIFGMIFGLKKEREESGEDIYSRYLPWDDKEHFAGSMEFEHQGTSYSLKRNFLGGAKETRLVNLDNGKNIYDAEKTFAEMLGGLSPEEYLSTYFHTSGFDKPDNGIASSLRKKSKENSKLQNVGIDVDFAIELLENKRRDYKDTQIVREIDKLEAVIESEEKTEKRLDELAREELSGLDEVDALNIELEKVSTPSLFEEKEQEFYTHKERYASYKRDTEETKRLSEVLEETIKQREELEAGKAKLERTRQQLQETRDYKKNYKDESQRITHELNEATKFLDLTTHNHFLKQNTILAGGLILILVSLTMLFLGVSKPIAIIAFLAGVALLVTCFINNLKFKKSIEQLKTDQKLKKELLENLHKEYEDYKLTHESEKNIVKEYEANLMMEGRIPEILNRENEIASLITDLEHQIKEKSEELLSFFSQFGPIDVLKDDELTLLENTLIKEKNERLATEAKLKESVNQLSEKLLKLHVQIEAGEENVLHLMEHREAKKNLLAKKQQNMDELQAIELAISIIEDISREGYESFGIELNEIASSYAAAFTEKKYTSFVTDENLNSKVDSYNRYISIDELSHGTYEQMNMALRLSAGDILLKKLELPLIFDESFVYYDDNRLAMALDRVCENGKQVIIFTCQNREEIILGQLNANYKIINL